MASSTAIRGGQAVMVIPPLDLVIAIYAGNDPDARPWRGRRSGRRT
jgi:hypothetical protein